MKMPVSVRSMAWLWPLLRPQRGRIAVGSGAAAFQTMAGLTAPYLFAIAIERAVLADDLSMLNVLAIVYLTLTGLNLLAIWVEALTVGRVSQEALHAVRCQFFAHLLRLPLTFYQEEGSGGVVARMVGDVEALTGLVSGGLLQLTSDVLTLTGIEVILVILDWRLALETLAVSPVLAAGLIWFQRRSAVAWRKVRKATSMATVALHEMITGIREIQGYGAEQAELSRLAGVNNRARQASRRTVALGAVFFPGVEFISAVVVVAVLELGGPRVLSGQLQIGTLTAFLLYLGLLFGPIFNMSEFYDTVQAAFAGGARIGAVLATEHDVRDPLLPVCLGQPRGEIRLAQVSFAYPRPGGAPGPMVLHDIDFVIPAGQTLALVGATGAGKTTIAGLLLRFYDPSCGQIMLDGIDLRCMRLAELRGAVSFVPQDGFLFSGTVKDNIRLGRPAASLAEIEAAIVALGAWSLIDRLPSGLDTEIGERGRRLASGERQLLALARAWIADPAVLVLDEATSYLDADADAQVSQALRKLRRGRTTVLIAHRLSSVLDADRVALIAAGRVGEVGSPAELIAAGGQFARLHARWAAATRYWPPTEPKGYSHDENASRPDQLYLRAGRAAPGG
jgi:ABC-type multidrug transport system fused ATPase/permease subunit